MLACSSLLSAQSPHNIDQAALKPGVDKAELSEPNGHEFSSSLSSEPLPDAPLPAEAPSAPPSSRSSNTKIASLQISSFPDSRQRFNNYLAGAFGPGAFIAAGISSAGDQTHSLKVGYPSDGLSGIGNHPDHGTVPEWGEGLDGYAKRYASRYGISLVSTTTGYGLGESSTKMFLTTNASAPVPFNGLLMRSSSPSLRTPRAVKLFPPSQRW